MAECLLSVVIPTLNRPKSVLRLLKTLECQSLPTSAFEVLVVDDGSEPPLELDTIGLRVSFAVRVVRRTGDHGAHESRFEGLRQAIGTRVLFLDDDLELSPEVLSEHAGAADSLAEGPIFYHPDSLKTPYQRYQAKRFAEESLAYQNRNDPIQPNELYICNSSGPTDLFMTVFHQLGSSFGSTPISGGCFDELLIRLQLRCYDRPVHFLPKAVAYHIDNKTVANVCREQTLLGTSVCRLLLHFPSVKHDISAYPILTGGCTSYKTWCARLLWFAPGFLKMIADLLTFVADHGPRGWIPPWICRFPLSFSYWNGMRSVVPSFKSLRALLVSSAASG